MKQLKTILLIFTILTSLTASTQDFGVKLGFNGANLALDDDEGKKMKPGLIFGVTAKFELSEKLNFQPELYFATWGAKFEFDGQDKDDAIALSGISLPLLFNYSLSSNVGLEFGPSITFISKAEIQDNEEPATTEDLKDLTKGSDLGFNVGLTFSPAEKVTIGLRYYLGLTDLYDLDDITTAVFKAAGMSVPTLKSSAIQLALTYNF
jgi:hypothetical protein